MGIAFHETLNEIYKQDSNLLTIMDLFQNELKSQRAESLNNYRERNLPWPRDFKETLENTLAVIFANRTHFKQTEVKPTFETTLISRDKLVIGRPDLVLDTSEGAIIIDYKTGRFDQENISNYENQILFYSGLWQEIHGYYPILGRVVFLIDGLNHEFTINKDRCISILADVRKIAVTLDPLESKLQAKVGNHCALCDYRPWCNEYWSRDKKNKDLEGVICNDHPRDSQSFCLKNDKNHRMVLNRCASPIPDWKIGTRVRILDPMVFGDIYYKGIFSELFRVLHSIN